MTSSMRAFWVSRSPRQRLAAAIAAAVLGTVAYLWLVYSAHRHRVQLNSAVFELRGRADRLDRSADEIARLRASQAAPPPQSDLRLLLQAQVASAGLSRWLLRIDPVNADQVIVVFGAVPFTDWLTWVENLKTQLVRLDATRIEAQSTPGLVSVTATMVRAHPH